MSTSLGGGNGIARGERLAWIRLARTEGVGAVTFARLVERFGTAERALAALPELQRRGTWKVGRVAGPEEAQGELAALARLGGRLLTGGEDAFPERLRHIPDPPPTLAVLGDASRLDAGLRAVALIGARNASANGCLLARRIAAELSAAGIVVVSGLARGIDTAAHKGALDGGGAGTVAVVAGGVDQVYPPENEGLAAAIAGGSGAIVGERPLGTVARAKDFPRRNRIIAGLSLGVVVVEAAPQSGSLITARLAAEQGREVMAVPGSPLDPRHRGTNQLLREGATLVEGAADVVAALDALGGLRVPRVTPSLAGTWDAGPAAIVETAPRPDADGLPGRVEARLGPTPLGIDDLVRDVEAPLAEVQGALLELELEGRIDRHPGNRVSLRAG